MSLVTPRSLPHSDAGLICLTQDQRANTNHMMLKGQRRQRASASAWALTPPRKRRWREESSS